MANQALIPVFTGQITEEQTQLCNARDLHASLQVGRDFSNWIKGRVEEYSFVEGVDFVILQNLSSPKSGSSKARRQTMTDYHLTLDMAKELAMVENNDVGRLVRRYFIKCEAELRADLRDKARHVLTLPGIKSLRSGINFKQTLVLQVQSRRLVELIVRDTSPAAQINMHYQLRQVNDALGIPTAPLADIICGQPALEA